MNDIDEPQDVHRLCERLNTSTIAGKSGAEMSEACTKSLETSSRQTSSQHRQGKVQSLHSECHYTRQALTALGLLSVPSNEAPDSEE